MKHTIALVVWATVVLGGITTAHAELGDRPPRSPNIQFQDGSGDSSGAETPSLESRVRVSMLPDSSTARRSKGRRVVIHGNNDDWDTDWDSGWARDLHFLSWPRRAKMDFFAHARYTRIEGIALNLGVRRSMSRRNYLPAYRLEGGYAFASRFGMFRVGFEQPVTPKNKVTIGAEGYRRFLPTFYGDEVISSGENSASMFFLKKEYRDWYENQGGLGFIGFHPSPYVTVHAGVRGGIEKTVPVATTWSVFNQHDGVRPNPVITDGDYFGYYANASFDSRPRKQHGSDPFSRETWSTVEHWYRVSWSRSDPTVRRDFDEWQVTADLRTYFRIARRQHLWGRLLVGWGDGSAGPNGDQLSAQRRYALGGIGTLRGQNFKSITGDRVFLANLEYAFAISGSFQALFLTDAGNAWESGSVFDQRILVDMGTGIRLGSTGISLVVAKNINRADSDVRAVFRLQDSF